MDFEKVRIIRARRRRKKFRGILRQKREFCSKIDLRGAPKSKNNKSKPRFLDFEKVRIIRTQKIWSPKILKGGFNY